MSERIYSLVREECESYVTTESRMDAFFSAVSLFCSTFSPGGQAWIIIEAKTTDGIWISEMMGVKTTKKILELARQYVEWKQNQLLGLPYKDPPDELMYGLRKTLIMCGKGEELKKEEAKK